MDYDLSALQERRGRERFMLRAAMTVLSDDREIPAFTQNMSNLGVYFCVGNSDSARIGQDIEFVIDLPPEITFSTGCRIRCRGRVVRTEKTSWDETGVAAEIVDYSIIRSFEC